jgi:hypothetical protein
MPSMPSEPSVTHRRWSGNWFQEPFPIPQRQRSHGAHEPTNQRAHRMQETHRYLVSNRQHRFEPMHQGAVKEPNSPRVKIKPSGVSLLLGKKPFSQSPRLPVREFRVQKPTTHKPSDGTVQSPRCDPSCGCVSSLVRK